MNFYELKLELNFPRLAGAIRRKSDVRALLELNEQESGRVWDLCLLIDLNKDERDRPYEQEIIDRLQRLYHMHRADIQVLQNYLKEHKMVE